MAVTSCGFTLRTESIGDRLSGIQLPDSLPRELQIAIERQVRVLDVAIVDEAATDAQTITSIEEFANQRSTRLDPLGRPIEYWMSIRWDVLLASEPQTPLVLHASESVGLSESALIGFEKEKRRISLLLREELATQLITRLALINAALEEAAH